MNHHSHESKDLSRRKKSFQQEVVFLDGPHQRRFEFGFVLRVMWDFIKGFRALHFVGPCITVFGSARLNHDSPYSKMAEEVGRRIAKMGFTVMTGGGPGIMQAANRGAQLAGGRSVGCNIVLPFEQQPNPFVNIAINIQYFFVRKVMLFKYSYGFVALPGGIGTMDELFEALTLIQTGKLESFPVILIGKDYYHHMVEFLKVMAKAGTIKEEDLQLFCLTDSLDEAMEKLEKHALEHLHRQKARIKARWWFLEKN